MKSFLPCRWQRLFILPPVPSLWWVRFESTFLMAWNKSTYSDGIVGLFLLLQRSHGTNPLVMPQAAWGCSFHSSGGAGSFLLFYLRLHRVVPFVMPLAARGCSFYSSGNSGLFLLLCLWGRCVWFDWCWLATVSVVLVRLTLACHSQRGFFLICADLLW